MYVNKQKQNQCNKKISNSSKTFYKASYLKKVLKIEIEFRQFECIIKAASLGISHPSPRFK